MVLNFPSCAPFQHKKNIVEGTVQRIPRSTSTWQYFDKALEENENIWLKNKYPEVWTSKIINASQNKNK